MKILVTDAENVDHEFEGESIYLKVEGPHTLVVDPRNRSPMPQSILGVFDNVVSAKVEE